MPLRRHACPRCHGDQHLSLERPPAWSCLACGHRVPIAVAAANRLIWERMLDEIRERAEV